MIFHKRHRRPIGTAILFLLAALVLYLVAAQIYREAMQKSGTPAFVPPGWVGPTSPPPGRP
jgi:uncharacterized membrane protein YozB (DUF420 family)